MGEKLIEDSDLICDDCGAQDATVKECYCPYDEDVKGIFTEVILCKHCYLERVMEI